MPAQDAVGLTREALTTVSAAVLRIRNEYGDTLGVRRLTSHESMWHDAQSETQHAR